MKSAFDIDLEPWSFAHGGAPAAMPPRGGRTQLHQTVWTPWQAVRRSEDGFWDVMKSL